MRRESFKNFITEDERIELVKWFESSKSFSPGASRGKLGYKFRETTRQQSLVDFPGLVYELKERAFKLFNFTDKCVPQPLPCGEPIIAVKTFKDGNTYSHRDPTSIDGLAVLRMNVIIQKPESGGVLHVMDENGAVIEWETDEGELHCYEVTQHTHAVTKVVGSTTRYILLFSMQVPYDDWEQERITKNGNNIIYNA